MIKKRLDNRNRLLHILFVCALIFIASYRIFDKPGLWFGDEFGYAGTAAYLGKMDWSSQIKHIGYYGVGYGILLAPAYIFCNSVKQIIIYANVLNVVLLLISYELAVCCMKQIMKSGSLFQVYVYSFCSILYINNLVQLQMDWSETLNLCLYWVILKLLINLFLKQKLGTYILLGVFMCFSIMVHMRNIGMVVASIIVLVFYLMKQS